MQVLLSCLHFNLIAFFAFTILLYVGAALSLYINEVFSYNCTQRKNMQQKNTFHFKNFQLRKISDISVATETNEGNHT